jgi:hypothetical protein
MDAQTTKDYLEDLVIKVEGLEHTFLKLNSIIASLQEQREAYKWLYEDACKEVKRLKGIADD